MQVVKPEKSPKQIELEQLYRSVLTSPAGLRVLRDIFRQAHVVRLNNENPNPNTALFMGAQIALVQTIMRHCGLTPVDLMEQP